ncbi:response regulator transcription factor [Actinosynnema sp. NPDC050436]|uniref:response regulator transcription factor n=1 Tax=Actinosynnema sp. NPDC050436 TaxID=3155659 RepID=UPI0033E08DB6
MRILLVEDDAHVAGALSEALERFGHAVDHVATGKRAVEAAADADFVLLDLGLPDLDGQEVCRRVRAASQVPIMVVTARSEEVDRVVLLQSGADDYLAKPYSTRELIARIDAVSRRTHGLAAAQEPPADTTPPDVRSAGPLRVDLRTRQVRVAGSPVELTRREFDLLAALMTDPGAVRSREELFDEVWDTHWHGSTRTLDVHVGTLRSKLGHREWIQSVRGVGFRVRVPESTAPGGS